MLLPKKPLSYKFCNTWMVFDFGGTTFLDSQKRWDSGLLNFAILKQIYIL